MLAPTPKRLFLRYRRRGDAAALGQLFDLVAPELLALATHLTRDVSIAEDVVQDTFLSAVESAARYDADRPFMPWLVGVLVNRARKARERSAIRSSREQGEPPAGLNSLETAGASASGRQQGASNDPADIVATEEVVGLVGRAIESLREPYRAVVREHLSGGLPPREIAVALGRSAGTIRVQLHRGLEQLRAALRPEPGGTDGNSAIERLGGMGLGMTAAVRLERADTRGLDAVRRAVLEGLGHIEGATGAAGTAGLQASTLGLAAKGALLAALVVAAITVVTRMKSLPAPELEVARIGDTAPATLVDPGDERLAPVAPRPTKIERETGAAESGAPVREQTGKRRSSARPRGQKPRPARAASSAPTTYPFVVQPRLHLDRVPGIDPFANATYTVVEKGGLQIGSGSGMALTLARVPIGEFASVDDLSEEITLRADHPEAMPATLRIAYSDWGFDGKTYVAEPAVTLEAIRATVQVRGRAHRVPSEAKASSSAPFDGDAVLVRIDPSGSLERIDTQPLRRTSRKPAALRSTRGNGTTYVLGLPKRDNESADLIEVDPPREGDLETVAHLRRRELSDAKVEVVDPFGRAYRGAKVIATVPTEFIAYFEPGSVVPTSIDGWVFANPSGMSYMFTGQVERHSGPDDLSLVLARGLIEDTTNGLGKARLEGALPGLHSFSIQTDLNAGPVPLGTYTSFAPRMTAPVVGLEVLCPVELLSIEGAKVWKGAKVTVVGGGQTIKKTVDAPAKLELLAPPDAALTVTLEASGWPPFRATVGPTRPGSKTRVRPLATDHGKTK